MKSNNTRLVKNTFFLYTRMIVILFISFYTVRVVLRELGVSDYGIYNVVVGFVSIFSVLNTTLSTGINRFYNVAIGKNNPQEISAVYTNALLIQILLAILLIILFETIGIWYFNNVLIIPEERIKTAFWIYQFAIISIIFQVIQVPFNAAIIAYEKIRYFAIISIIDSILKLSIALLIGITNKDKLLIYGFLIMFISIFNFLMYYIYCKHNLKNIKLEKTFDINTFKSMLTFSGYYMFNVFAFTLRNQGSNLVLNYFFGPIINAAYAIANQVYMAIENVGANLITACKPQIIQAYSSDNYYRVKSLLFSMTKITFVLNLIICLILYFELPQLLNLWLGNDYPEIAITFSRIIILVNVMSSFAPLINVTINAIGDIKQYMIISSIIIILSIPISFIGLKIGLPSYIVFLSILIVTCIQMVASIILLSKKFPYITSKEYFIEILKPCLITLTLTIPIPLLIITFIQTSFIRIIIIIAVTIIECMILSYFIIFNQDEKSIVKTFIKEKISNK